MFSFFFFSSEKEGPGSSRPNHPACGHTQPLLPVLPLKGSLGLGLETMGKPLGEASALIHEMGRQERERPPHIAGDVPLPSHRVRTPRGFLRPPTEVSMRLKHMGRTARSEFQDQEAH